MALPCTCDAPNESCKRAGVPMVGRLWELCSGNCPTERPCAREKSEQYRELWDSQKVDRTKPCNHRGLIALETVECPSCMGKVKVKIFPCSIHGKCSIGKPLPEVACCAICPDYKSE